MNAFGKWVVFKNSSVAHEFKNEDDVWCGCADWERYVSYYTSPRHDERKYGEEMFRTHISVVTSQPDIPTCANCLKVKNRVLKERGNHEQ